MTQVGMSEVTASPLTTQVAGHVFHKNNRKMGMLSLGPNIVLKALQDGPRGARELDFYTRVTSTACTDRDSIAVRRFLAAFHGTVEIDGVKFMKLENVTSSYVKPCIADLKMGKISYDPFAAPEKVAHQKAKCPSAAILGFQISGMMVYHPHCDEFERMDKLVGHKLTTDNMLKEGIGKFFGYPLLLRKDVISRVISRLHNIEDWFKKQKQYVFYASSLLVVYEGSITCEDFSNSHQVLCSMHGSMETSGCKSLHPDVSTDPSIVHRTSHSDISTDQNIEQKNLHSDVSSIVRRTSHSDSYADQNIEQKNLNSDVSVEPSIEHETSHPDVIADPTTEHSTSVKKQHSFSTSASPPVVDVRMIDFTHVMPSSDIDNNYLAGLQNLIDHLHTLLDLHTVCVNSKAKDT